MSRSKHVSDAATTVVLNFLQKLIPFSEVDPETLRELARGAMVAFYPKNQVILEQDVDEPSYLFLIEKGAVRVYRKNDEGTPVLVDHRGEGSTFGVSHLMGSSKSSATVEAAEDTFCYLIHKAPFMEFVSKHPLFLENYFQCLSKELVGKTYSEWHFDALQSKVRHGLHILGATVADMPLHPVLMIDGSVSVHEAAGFMTDRDISLVLVCDSDKKVEGFLGDKDLRTRVVALKADYDRPIRDFMNSPVPVVSPSASRFDAIVQMMGSHAEYLLVEEEGHSFGLVAQRDLSAFQSVSPFALLGEIDAQSQIDDLYVLSGKIPLVVGSLLEGGAKANDIAAIISILNDHLVGRILTLTVEQLGPPPTRFCWLLVGSEGRSEQTFRTDQDNGLLYEDPGEDKELLQSSMLYFRRLGNVAIDHLVKCGFPLCKGGIMASKTTWRKPYSVWIGYFDHWMSSTDDEDTLHAKIFLDFRSGFGATDLAAKLSDYVSSQALSRKSFLKHLARDALNIKPPLSLFRNFIVESDGEHKDRLDLKMRGLVPIVDVARALALRYGIRKTNTFSRLEMLINGGHIPSGLGGDILEAYEFLQQIRLMHQMRMIELGKEPHNYLDPAELSDLEKHTLKGAFTVISEMQSFVAKVRTSF